MGILTVERLRSKRRTFHVPNLMHKLLESILNDELRRPLYIVKMNVGRRLVQRLVWMFSSLSESTIKRTSFESTQIGIKFGI